MRPIRTISVFPTLLTLGNLICGFFAIVVAARVDKPVAETLQEKMIADAGAVMLSGALIFLAMIFDGLDGYVARLARTTSDFGAQLDSLCDVVSFGVAPGFLLVKMCPWFTLGHNQTVWIIAAAFAACAALRLARFNVETTDDDEHLYFSGLPSPAAASVIAGFAIMFYTLRTQSGLASSWRSGIDTCLQDVLPLFAALVALLMVSRIHYPHVTNRVLRGQRSFGHVVAVVFFLVAIMVFFGYAMAIAASAFALYGPIHLAWQLWVQRRRREEPLF
ncbi:MAG: CDP-diacylglycerol--serine O-phosphatidyltransferase [Planctomycetaceae bacterium]|nr:CDP-diacylglycerol--serine O-phosphatidyltransferase [Planctomycetaceae bacterium]